MLHKYRPSTYVPLVRTTWQKEQRVCVWGGGEGKSRLSRWVRMAEQAEPPSPLACVALFEEGRALGCRVSCTVPVPPTWRRG